MEVTPDTPVSATLFNGTNARRFPVLITWDDIGVNIRGDTIEPVTLEWKDLYFADRSPDAIAFGRTGAIGWRLRVPTDAPLSLIAKLPSNPTYGKWIDRIGLKKAVVIMAFASAAIGFAVFTAPTWLGPLVPESVEHRIGDALVGDIDKFTCHTSAGDAALARLVSKLDPENKKASVQIVKVDMINAVALPGGKVLIFNGLLQDAQSADEVAGVLGHEIGHVRKRHVMQSLLREFGLSVLMSGTNSSLSNTLGGLTAMGYSRGSEAEADDFSQQRLAVNNISPGPTATFFGRLRKLEGLENSEALTYFASHPNTASREHKFAAAVKQGQNYSPAISNEEFEAMRNACKADKRAEEWSLL